MVQISSLFVTPVGLVAAAIGLSSSGVVGANPVQVELYFEAFCPGCHEFIMDELTPAVADSELAAIMNVTLVPYGNAQTSRGGIVQVSCSEGVEG